MISAEAADKADTDKAGIDEVAAGTAAADNMAVDKACVGMGSVADTATADPGNPAAAADMEFPKHCRNCYRTLRHLHFDYYMLHIA